MSLNTIQTEFNVIRVSNINTMLLNKNEYIQPKCPTHDSTMVQHPAQYGVDSAK